ncbi:hypothetical protein NDU88_003727 [Pleurodeles waltl]|uniref:Uncharacterized protein n=1 Tax=Pleurodeles waltl TaxID=8319 RepID=A0AAV7QGE4_PLEWA|nr:hypothetical protein NDU88_003727 [Pleurodeles waltl]
MLINAGLYRGQCHSDRRAQLQTPPYEKERTKAGLDVVDIGIPDKKRHSAYLALAVLHHLHRFLHSHCGTGCSSILRGGDTQAFTPAHSAFRMTEEVGSLVTIELPGMLQGISDAVSPSNTNPECCSADEIPRAYADKIEQTAGLLLGPLIDRASVGDGAMEKPGEFEEDGKGVCPCRPCGLRGDG